MTRLFICGFGRRAHSHALSAAKVAGVEIVGAFDPAPEARAQAQRLKAGMVYANLESGLRQTRPDSVLICTPPRVRLELVRVFVADPGIRAVIVEKPLALSVSEAREICRLCEERGVQLIVAHQLRFSPEFAALKTAVDSGRLGRPVFLRAACFGNLFDQGSHMVDLLRWLAGDARVQWVDATACDDLPLLATLRPLPPESQKDTVHPGTLWTNILMRFTSGAEAMLSCGVLDSIPEPSVGPWLQKRVVAVGPEGTAQAHVASHFVAISKQGGEQRIRTDPGSYEYALVSFYEAVVDALDGKPQRFPAMADHIHTLEVMAAALASGSQHRPVAVANLLLPPVRTVPRESGHGPAVSIILPMEDHRGMGLKAVASWTAEQRCAPEDFELIVLIDRHTQKLEAGIRDLLRSHDRLVYRDTANEMEQYHLGATLAKGGNLFFTEPHCIAEPEAIAECIRFFRTEPVDGICGRTTPICANSIGEMESRMYDEGFVEWSRPSNWTKVILRAFAIRKEVYFEAGGFDFRFDRFAEWLLAATLRRRGFTLAYAPGVGVAHFYSDQFCLLDRFIQEFTDGECLFRLENSDPDFCAQFFGLPPEWAEARSFNHDLTWRGLRNVLGLLLWPRKATRTLSGYQAAARQALWLLAPAMLGRRFLILRCRLRIICGKLRFYLPFSNVERKFLGFLDFWRGTTALYRVKYGLSAPVTQPEAISEILHYSLDSIHEQDLYGFHAPEVFDGERFRWCSGSGAIRLSVRPGRYRAKLQILGVRAITDPNREMAVFVNHRLVEDVTLDASGKEIHLELEPRHFTDDAIPWLMIFVRPWRDARITGGDSRELGLPIRELTLVPGSG